MDHILKLSFVKSVATKAFKKDRQFLVVEALVLTDFKVLFSNCNGSTLGQLCPSDILKVFSPTFYNRDRDLQLHLEKI